MAIITELLDLSAPASATRDLDLHLTMATGFIPPYLLPVYVALARRVQKLSVLLSTPMEANRQWTPEWGTLDVHIQRTWRVERHYRDPAGYKHQTYIYIPRDTIRQLRQLRPDVIISSGLGLRSATCALYRRLHRDTALILWHAASEHSEKKWGASRHWLRKRLVRKADAFVANGASGARYLQSLGCAAANIFHGPYVAIPDTFDQGPLERPAEAAHRLLYVGRLLDWKGLQPFIEVLLRYAQRHPERQLEFTLIGSGPLEAHLRTMATPRNLALRVLPEHAPRDLAKRYQEAGIFVFPTFDDEWGLVVNEAMASGLPVLGSLYSQAVDELCLEHKTGWRFHPDNADEMYQSLSRALDTSPVELNVMRQAARDCVQHLTPDYVADRLLEAVCAARKVQRGTCQLGVRP